MAALTRLMLVEDDDSIRLALTDMLQDEGFAVSAAVNGREALALLREEARPEAILLDLMMPVMDGYGFLQEQRKDPVLSSIPVAVITAGHGVDLGRIGGGTPIVPKPIDVPKLASLLRDLSSLEGRP